MHRTHDAAAVSVGDVDAALGGSANVSVDLIFALPDALAAQLGARPRPGVRTRAGAPLAVRPHHRRRHAARPVDGGGRLPSHENATPPSTWRPTGCSPRRDTSTTRCRTRLAPVAGPGTTAPTGDVRRSSGSGRRRIPAWLAPVVECARVGSTNGWSMQGDRPAERSVWHRSKCGWRSSTSGFARPMAGQRAVAGRSSGGVGSQRLGGGVGRSDPSHPGGLAPARCPRAIRRLSMSLAPSVVPVADPVGSAVRPVRLAEPSPDPTQPRKLLS